VSTATERWAIHIEAHLNDLPTSMRHVGRYVLQNQRHASRFDLNTLARETGVSKTTIVRFCQHLGFEGYRDFYAGWVASLSHANEERRPSATRKSLIEAVFDEVVQDLARTLHLVDPAAVERAAALIDGAPALYFYGLGDSEGVAISAAHRFTILGKPSRAIVTIESLSLDGTLFAPGSVVCAISQSGFHPHSHAMGPLHEHFAGGERVIALTSNPKSKLARFASTLLLTSASDLQVGKAKVTFRACQMAVIDALAFSLALSTRAGDLAGPLFERVTSAAAPPAVRGEEVAPVE
jgi:RpiR family transcriptional regulator, carbohydrate utilization regulator